MRLVARVLSAAALVWSVVGCECSGQRLPSDVDGDVGERVQEVVDSEDRLDVPEDRSPAGEDGIADVGEEADAEAEDSAADDGGSCVPSEEFCNGLDDDCDGEIDDGVWCWVHPWPTGNKLTAVWCFGDGEAWAVGWGPTVLRRTGGTWTHVRVPFEDDLYDVWATGPRDVWVAGMSGATYRWNGVDGAPRARRN